MNKNLQGFTLIEVMVTVALVAILAALALPSFSEYVARSRLPDAFDGLASYRMRMEQAYQDNGNYGINACSVAPPATEYFDFNCQLEAGGQDFTATATGKGAMQGYAFAINAANVRETVAFPGGATPFQCWASKKGGC